MKKKLLTICFTLLFLDLVRCQNNWQWAQSPVCSNSDNSNCVVTDAAGNVLVTGFFFSSNIVFGSYTLTNSGNYDVFVVKYDPNGNVLWAKSAGGTYDDVGCSIATDPSGNVYVCGYYYSPLLSFNNYSLTNSGGGDGFLAKYDAMGNELWVNNIGDSGDENALSVCTDNSGNIYMTGYFQSSLLMVGSTTLSCAGNNDVFIIKYTSSGNPVWATSAGGSNNDTGRGIITDPSGNIFITGFFYSPFLSIGTTTLNSYGSSDAFIAKFDSAGNPLWGGVSGGGFNDASYAITGDAAGNIYITGGYLSSVFSAGTFTHANSGAFDLFITKYSNAGNVLWTRKAGGGQDDIGYGIASDALANIYVTGHFHSPSISFGGTILSNAGIGDMFLVKADSAGNMLWAESAGGTTDDGGSSVACDVSGDVYATGYFFSSSVSFSNTTLLNNGSDDMFLAKYLALTTSFNTESDFPGNVSVYPNPSQNHFILSGANGSVIKMTITDLNGKEMEVSSSYDRDKICLDLNGCVPGIYFLTLRTTETLISKKLVLLASNK